MAMNPERWSTPRRTRAAWWALGLVAVVAAAAAGSWAVKARDNRVIEAAQAMAHADDSELHSVTPALLFAQAHELAVAENLELALVRYRALYSHPRFGPLARYNSGNLLMRQALALRDAGADTATDSRTDSSAATESAGQALPLIELAKQSYREVLRADPGQWDARYNYERAQRAQPDPDEMDAPIGEPRAQAERSPTTTRGVGGGLP